MPNLAPSGPGHDTARLSATMTDDTAAPQRIAPVAPAERLPPRLGDLDDPVVQELVAARVNLLFAKPFIGQMAARLLLVDASSWCRTAATDGRHLYYNRAFVKALSRPKLMFLVGHEVLHCVLDHIGRRGGRDPRLWNAAIDYLDNFILKQERLGEMPDGGLYDPRFTDEMTADEVYDFLKRNAITLKIPLDGENNGEHLDRRDQAGGESGGDQGGAGRPEADATLMGRDGPPRLTEADLQRIRHEIRAAAIQTAQQVGADKVPLGIRRMIDALVTPKLDWRALLDSHIRSSVKDDYTFQRLSRRGDGDFILPSQDVVDRATVHIGIDASGSMTADMLRDLTSEVYGIMTAFRDFEVHLWSFDTQVHNHKIFTSESIEDLRGYEAGGGGDTLFEANWEFMKREGMEPQRFVMFTDGLPGSGWGDPDFCDTLFIIHSNSHIAAPFGLTAHYEP